MRLSSACRIAVLAVLSLLAASAGAADPAAERVRKVSEFAKGMKEHDATLPALWFDNEDFWEIHQHPTVYVKEIEALISGTAGTETEKRVAVGSMQHLPPADYLKFINRLAELRSAGRISENIFISGVLPAYNETTFLTDNYRDARVKAFLKKARGLIKKESFLSFLSEIESGASARELKKLRQGEQLKDPPRKLPTK